MWRHPALALCLGCSSQNSIYYTHSKTRPRMRSYYEIIIANSSSKNDLFTFLLMTCPHITPCSPPYRTSHKQKPQTSSNACGPVKRSCFLFQIHHRSEGVGQHSIGDQKALGRCQLGFQTPPSIFQLPGMPWWCPKDGIGWSPSVPWSEAPPQPFLSVEWCGLGASWPSGRARPTTRNGMVGHAGTGLCDTSAARHAIALPLCFALSQHQTSDWLSGFAGILETSFAHGLLPLLAWSGKNNHVDSCCAQLWHFVKIKGRYGNTSYEDAKYGRTSVVAWPSSKYWHRLCELQVLQELSWKTNVWWYNFDKWSQYSNSKVIAE